MSGTPQPSTSPPRAQTPAEMLATPVQFAPGVGPQKARLLARLELFSVADLVFCFPRDYQDLSDRRTIADLEEDKLQTIRGVVTEVDATGNGFGKSRVGVLVSDGRDSLRAMWFDQPFMRAKFQPGQQVLLSAKPRHRGGRWEMAHPRVTWLGDEQLDGEQEEFPSRLLPIYPLTEGLSQWEMRRIVAAAVERFGPVLEEVFPAEMLAELQLMPLAEALKAIHSPADATELERARRRFVFQELFILELAVVARRRQQQLGFRAPPLEATAAIDARIRRRFPFELTPGQQAAIRDVAADLARDVPMNRLLQGDVGSGKTIVALYAMLVCVAHGHQAVLMSPTEVLARQHADTLAGILQQSRVRHRLLVGGLGGREREKALAEIAAGEVDLVIGTQAVLQEDVRFSRLGLVVIDEQHKFGVRQRAALRNGNQAPHYLVMTATPIPRSITMTLFGDLDVTSLRDMPPGRQPVSTYLVEPEKQAKWWQFAREKLRAGMQAFVVVPLVDESTNAAVASVAAAYERLTNGELADFRVGLLHGRMTPQEKAEAMSDFRGGRIQVLVSTSVIEVGVDIPNAALMIVDSPQRFGLAQLHQLRGRVGRGAYPGYCGLLVDDELTDEARERLMAFQSTSDGFELAELDFAQRGPGDLFGTDQHGVAPLRIANLQTDAAVVEEARSAAERLFATDAGLAKPENFRLRRQMLIRYGKALELGDVG